MNILITGGAGFIGYNLAKRLTKSKHTVNIIDNFRTSKPIYESVYKIDLADINQNINILEELINEADIVVHLASSVGVDSVVNHPKSSLHNSFNINHNLFPLFEKYKSNVIFASTSEVYGSGEKPFSEKDNMVITSPNNSTRGSYATQKLMAEFLIKSYNFPFEIVRFFNIVGGTNQNPDIGMVFPRFINAAKLNEDINIFGDGSQIRSYCDIRDAVNMLEILMYRPFRNEIMNIGAENIYTTKELAENIIRITKSSSSIIYNKGREFEIQSRIPDITKMKNLYIPKYNLENIIMNSI